MQWTSSSALNLGHVCTTRAEGFVASQRFTL